MNRPAQIPRLNGLEEYNRILQLLDERRFDEAQVRGRVLLESAETGLLTRAKAHNLVCWTFIEGLKRPAPEAVLHGEEAVRLAGAVEERTLQAQAMMNLASAYYQVGDYRSARTTYDELLLLTGSEPNLVPCGQALAHCGIAHIALVQGQCRESLAHLNAAQGSCMEGENRFMEADLHRRKALVFLKLNQPDHAALSIAKINEADLTSGPRSLWWKTHLNFTRARVEMGRGHTAKAKSMATNTLALARELADLPVMAECTCLLALIEHAEGRKEAYKRARTAITYSIHSGRRDVLDEVRDRLKIFMIQEL